MNATLTGKCEEISAPYSKSEYVFQLTLNPNLFAKKPKLPQQSQQSQQPQELAPAESVTPSAASIKEEPDSDQLLVDEGGCDSGAAPAATGYQHEAAGDAEQSLMKMQLRK